MQYHASLMQRWQVTPPHQWQLTPSRPLSPSHFEQMTPVLSGSAGDNCTAFLAGQAPPEPSDARSSCSLIASTSPRGGFSISSGVLSKEWRVLNLLRCLIESQDLSKFYPVWTTTTIATRPVRTNSTTGFMVAIPVDVAKNRPHLSLDYLNRVLNLPNDVFFVLNFPKAWSIDCGGPP